MEMNAPDPELSPQSWILGLDIGGTNIKAVAVSLQGQRLVQMLRPTLDTPGERARADRARQRAVWIERIQEIQTHMEARMGTPAALLGIAAPGLIAQDSRSVAWMQGRMEAIQDLDWTAQLKRDNFVPVINDAHAALLGESWVGAARGSRNVALLTLGTGVGGAALVDGHLLRGHIGRAGHLGHISLNPEGLQDIVGTPGSLEDAIGDCTLAARSGGRFQTTAQLLAAIRQGNGDAQAVWQGSMEHLAAGIVSLVNVLDPEIVIVGGGMIHAGDLLFQPLQALLEAWEWRPTGNAVRIVPAELGEWAGATGAAYRALQSES